MMEPRPGVWLAALLLTVVAGCGPDQATTPDAPAPPAVTEPGAEKLWCPGKGGDRRFDAQTLVGTSLDAAEKRAADYACIVRVVERDGEAFPVTLDFSPGRINVVVEGDAVTQVQSIG